jgi:HAD superfamily phosphatase (TIGR01681 family)
MILVFDFDLTLISNHSKGYPISTNLPLIDEETVEKYNKYFRILKRKHNVSHIMINSRGLKSEIKEYLNKCNIHVDNIYGARNSDEISSNDWPNKKTRILNRISKKYTNGDKSKIYFYDDTAENINFAIENGYNNSHLVIINGIKLLKWICKNIE